jgi:nucleotide-binding universal stress UspA family protein
VDAARTRSTTHADLAHRAQALVRSLAGVTHAHVLVGPTGIDAIHVVAADHDVARALPANVRSALLAGLATSVRPARVTVRVPENDDAAARAGKAAQSSVPNPRLRLLEGDVEGSASDPAPDSEPGVPAADRARLVAVDLAHRDNGEVSCRTAIAWRSDLFHGEAAVADADAPAAQAAAQATIQALQHAGIDGLRLEGVVEIPIGGRAYMVVAVSRNDTGRRFRSGSAPCFRSPERGAAEATLVAAHELI